MIRSKFFLEYIAVFIPAEDLLFAETSRNVWLIQSRNQWSGRTWTVSTGWHVFRHLFQYFYAYVDDDWTLSAVWEIIKDSLLSLLGVEPEKSSRRVE